MLPGLITALLPIVESHTNMTTKSQPLIVISNKHI